MLTYAEQVQAYATAVGPVLLYRHGVAVAGREVFAGDPEDLQDVAAKEPIGACLSQREGSSAHPVSACPGASRPGRSDESRRSPRAGSPERIPVRQASADRPRGRGVGLASAQIRVRTPWVETRTPLRLLECACLGS